MLYLYAFTYPLGPFTAPSEKLPPPAWGFLPIYLGPVLAMTIGWIVIRKMIRVSKEYGLTSVSDFISFRYGSSYAIGAVVAVLSLIMVTPYVALQLIAISTSLDILSGPHILLGFVESKLLVALLLKLLQLFSAPAILIRWNAMKA